MINRLDHLVLTVSSIPATVEFYTEVLGMRAVEKSGRHALHFGSQKINLHQTGHEFEPKALRPLPGSADLCFIASVPLPGVIERLARSGVTLIDGPVLRNGALGPMSSIYFRDPDGNLIEVSDYGSVLPDEGKKL